MICKDLLDKPQYLFIFDSFSQNFEEDLMIYGVKVAFDVRFENKTGDGVVLGDFSLKRIKSFNGVERSFSQPVRKRITHELPVKNRFDNITERMMHYPITKCRLAYLSRFWIAENERFEWLGLVRLQEEFVS